MSAALFLTILAPFSPAEEPAREKARAAPWKTLSVGVAADFLALRAEIKAPEGATAVRYRFGELTEIAEDAAWIDVAGTAGADGVRRVEVPLPKSRWTMFQVRAWKGEEVLGTYTKRPKVPELTLLAPEKIERLPEAERGAWREYVERSERLAAAEFDVLAAECRRQKMAKSAPAPAGRPFKVDRDPADAWWRGEDAGKLAEVVMSFQTPSGAWSKSISFQNGPRLAGVQWTSGGDPWHYCGTLDNRATTEQIRFLAAVHAATGREEAKAAVVRGLEWLLVAQFPNGGWPQTFPLDAGYHEAITLNDDAMLLAMWVALDVARGRAPFGFVDEELRQRMREAFERALNCLAAAQVMFEGRRSVWCAQHDPLTLQPAPARLKEPPALSGGESATLLKFLMTEFPPADDRVAAMVEPAVAWLEAHRVTGLRKITNAAGKTDYVADPTSTEVYWARFYHPVTGKPMFAGAEDGIVYETFSEMAAKNRVGYDYFVTKPAEILEKEWPRWKARRGK